MYQKNKNGLPMFVRKVARKFLPSGVRNGIGQAVKQTGEWITAFHLNRLRHRMHAISPGTDETVRLLHYTIRIKDGMDFYSQYKEIFVKRIYHFEAQRRDPFILDCGSNIGVSILYFKHVYPQARIIGFEPDPTIFAYLEENLDQNGLTDIHLVQSALSTREGLRTFYSDGTIGSCLVENLPEDIRRQEWIKYEVPCIRLRNYLTEPVDFLKMNIESAEWEILADCGDRLQQVREMVVEYHHFPGVPRTLHKILELLHHLGFEYLVNDFGPESNGVLHPPFRLTPKTRYWLLVYAKRMK